MNYVELSIENVRKRCNDLYNLIVKDYNYDIVIFIAKGSFIIGDELAKLNKVPLLEIKATRKGSKIKKIIKPFINLLPKRILLYLRKFEMNNNYHEKNSDRNIYYDETLYNKYKTAKKILLVDDSIDSGNTIAQVNQELEKYFKDSIIKIAVFNVMKKSNIKPDYYLYEDTMINGPWSNDSNENKKFNQLYKEWVQNFNQDTLPNISVAMATYNGSAFLKEQIDSILVNLNDKDELIISDDGSTDETLEILHNYAKKDSRIVIINGPQQGIIKNFENALKHCSNDYIFLSDQDDIWSDNKKAVILSYLIKSDIIAIVHDATVIDENGTVLMDSWFEHRKSNKGFIKNLIKNRYLGCCMAFNRKLLNIALPIPANVEMHDWWLGLNAELYGKTIFIKDKLLEYRRHENNNSSLKHYKLTKMIKNRVVLICQLIKRKKNKRR